MPGDRDALAAQLATAAHLYQLAAQLRGERVSTREAVDVAIDTLQYARARLEKPVAPPSPPTLGGPSAEPTVPVGGPPGPPQPPVLQAGALLADRFQVTDVLSRGISYEAEEQATGRRVVLRLLPDLADDRGAQMVGHIKQEVLAHGRGDHPNVARLLDVGLLGATPWLVLEQLRGSPLRHRIVAARSGLPVAEAVELLLQISDGLQAIHDAGVVHGDLRPENVMLVGRSARILGYWMALLEPWRGRPESRPVRRYQAPELREGGALSVATDVFSLGVIAYELFSGASPFPTAMIPALQTRPRSLPDKVPDAVGELVLGAIHHDPERRPGSARAFAAALRQAWDPFQS